MYEVKSQDGVVLPITLNTLNSMGINLQEISDVINLQEISGVTIKGNHDQRLDTLTLGKVSDCCPHVLTVGGGGLFQI